MATPTQSPTNVPEETDPFFYDYATVQTVGMTLATIMFVLGIIIILSKKVKCRKADSSPTCKSCKSELPSSAPGGGGVWDPLQISTAVPGQSAGTRGPREGGGDPAWRQGVCPQSAARPTPRPEPMHPALPPQALATTILFVP
uniref:FXYD domain-containing ion transport regulator n=2 Tax=Mus musculus TaxID=10090 RepID=Q6P8R9_MOUSE|nr:Fxyd7 protein [Mus musculus]